MVSIMLSLLLLRICTGLGLRTEYISMAAICLSLSMVRLITNLSVWLIKKLKQDKN